MHNSPSLSHHRHPLSSSSSSSTSSPSTSTSTSSSPSPTKQKLPSNSTDHERVCTGALPDCGMAPVCGCNATSPTRLLQRIDFLRRSRRRHHSLPLSWSSPQSLDPTYPTYRAMFAFFIWFKCAYQKFSAKHSMINTIAISYFSKRVR